MERAPQVDLDGLCRAALRGADELERDNVVVARRNRVRPVSAALGSTILPASSINTVKKYPYQATLRRDAARRSARSPASRAGRRRRGMRARGGEMGRS